jgi:glycosyltransferase involved in cell wall biosynthesis
MLLALSSLLGAPGGIPSFNRLLIRAASDFAQVRRLPLHIVALTDEPGADPDFLAGLPRAVSPTYVACRGNRRLFAAEVLGFVGRESAVVLGHVNLSPLGLGFSRFGVIAHGTDVWSPLPILRRWSLQRSTVAAGVSEDTLRKLCAVQGVKPDRCQRLVNALDEQSLALAAATPKTACESSLRLRIVAITRLWIGEPKGIDLVIRSLPQLPDVDFEVVGEGAAHPQLVDLAQSLGVADRVHCVGRLSETEKHAAISRSHALVLPSSGEGFGIVYLEAMAHRKPCLAASVGGAPEVVLDGETGVVVEPTVQAVCAGILRLRDPSLRQRLGDAGYQRLYDHFTYAAFARHAEPFFARLY